MIEILAGVGSISSALIATITCITLLVKPVREKVLGINAQKDALKCLLRNEITTFYYKHLNSSELRQYEFENLERLYKAYKALNGNSFIDRIYIEMRDEWKII